MKVEESERKNFPHDIRWMYERFEGLGLWLATFLRFSESLIFHVGGWVTS